MSARRCGGFTLPEVLTALVVIGILAAIAIPSWRTHLLRARRADAAAALTAVQRAQDSFFARHARYADASQMSAASPDGLGLAQKSAGGWYAVELRTAADGFSYLATATPVPDAGQSADERCVRFTIDNLGSRRAYAASGEDRSPDCWR